MGVIDEDRWAVLHLASNDFHPARYLRAGLDPSGDFVGGDAEGMTDSACNQNVFKVEVAKKGNFKVEGLVV